VAPHWRSQKAENSVTPLNSAFHASTRSITLWSLSGREYCGQRVVSA
jgi:hypothetical protein